MSFVESQKFNIQSAREGEKGKEVSCKMNFFLVKTVVRLTQYRYGLFSGPPLSVYDVVSSYNYLQTSQVFCFIFYYKLSNPSRENWQGPYSNSLTTPWFNNLPIYQRWHGPLDPIPIHVSDLYFLIDRMTGY